MNTAINWFFKAYKKDLADANVTAQLNHSGFFAPKVLDSDEKSATDLLSQAGE